MIFKNILYKINWYKKYLPQYIFLRIRKLLKPQFERNGIIYRINNPSDLVERALYFRQEHDNRKYMFSKIKTGMTVLDIGSNIGDTLCQISQKIWEKGFVYGFEPCQKTFLICRENITLNKICNSKIYNIGLGDQEKNQNIFINPKNRGTNHISILGTEQIHLKTLDDWVEDHKNEFVKIDFIKIDVEGYEYKVLKWGEKTLRKYSPELFFEVDINFLKRYSTSWGQISDFLESLWYECINTENGMQVWREWLNHTTHVDIYAFKK